MSIAWLYFISHQNTNEVKLSGDTMCLLGSQYLVKRSWVGMLWRALPSLVLLFLCCILKLHFNMRSQFFYTDLQGKNGYTLYVLIIRYNSHWRSSGNSITLFIRIFTVQRDDHWNQVNFYTQLWDRYGMQ